MFLSHLTLFALAFHHTSFSPEGFHLPIEEGIFAEFAFQAAVVEWDFDARFQPDLLETFFAIAQNPSFVATKLMLQTFANHLVRA